MFLNIILCVGIFMSVRAELTPEDKQELFLDVRSMTEKCLKEFDMTFDEMIKKKYDGTIDPCFLACTLKGNKVINDKGMFDLEEASKLSEKFAKNEEMRKKIQDFHDICIAVNEKDVSDGEQGCERAKLLMECFKKVIVSHA